MKKRKFVTEAHQVSKRARLSDVSTIDAFHCHKEKSVSGLLVYSRDSPSGVVECADLMSVSAIDSNHQHELQQIVHVTGGKSTLLMVCQSMSGNHVIHLWERLVGYFWIRGQRYRHHRFETNGHVRKVSCGIAHHVVLMTDGSLIVHGCNKWLQLANQPANHGQPIFFSHVREAVLISDVCCGSSHTMLVSVGDQYDRILSRGLNSMGQTGGPDLNHYHALMEVPWLSSIVCRRVRSITCQKNNTVIVTQTNEVLIYGNASNLYGNRPMWLQAMTNTIPAIVSSNVLLSNVFFLQQQRSPRSVQYCLAEPVLSRVSNFTVKKVPFVLFDDQPSQLFCFHHSQSVYSVQRQKIQVWNGERPWSMVDHQRSRPNKTNAIFTYWPLPDTSHEIQGVHLTDDALYVWVDVHDRDKQPLCKPGLAYDRRDTLRWRDRLWQNWSPHLVGRQFRRPHFFESNDTVEICCPS